jgi:hypothetical protein
MIVHISKIKLLHRCQQSVHCTANGPKGIKGDKKLVEGVAGRKLENADVEKETLEHQVIKSNVTRDKDGEAVI